MKMNNNNSYFIALLTNSKTTIQIGNSDVVDPNSIMSSWSYAIYINIPVVDVEDLWRSMGLKSSSYSSGSGTNLCEIVLRGPDEDKHCLECYVNNLLSIVPSRGIELSTTVLLWSYDKRLYVGEFNDKISEYGDVRDHITFIQRLVS